MEDIVADAADLVPGKDDRGRGEIAEAARRIDSGAQHGEDRGMVERGERAGLAPEAHRARRVGRFAHGLHGDVPPERVLPPEPDFAHAAFVDRAQERESSVDAVAGLHGASVSAAASASCKSASDARPWPNFRSSAATAAITRFLHW